jgi:hypothetical protein
MIKQHTPGPWEVVDGYYPSFKDVTGPSFKISVVMWATDLTEDDYQKRNADLHLIAAAPELLEALEELCRRLGPRYFLEQSWADPLSAIAKARGQQ